MTATCTSLTPPAARTRQHSRTVSPVVMTSSISKTLSAEGCEARVKALRRLLLRSVADKPCCWSVLRQRCKSVVSSGTFNSLEIGRAVERSTLWKSVGRAQELGCSPVALSGGDAVALARYSLLQSQLLTQQRFY